MPDSTRPANLQFELFFPAEKMTAWSETDVDGKERFYIGGTGSSTMMDLKGSIIKPEAQVQMLEKLNGLASKMADKNSGMTAWLNHSYKIPEDTLGAFTAAALTTRTGDGNGNGDPDQTYIDLDIKCRLVDFKTNPRAEAAYNQVKDGIRHGWSIGAYFLEIEWISDDPKSPDFWNYYVTSIELLEVSLVGIPANQRAWVRDAESAKAYAVKCAEKIATDHSTAKHRRELVQRSMIENRGLSGASRLALAEDFRERAKQPHLDAENVSALTRAAEALETLDDGEDMSPDDMRDRINMAISHAAKAVGHGLCIKSATHIARCIDCLSTVVGANGGEAEPAGDEDPNQMAALLTAAKKLELKAGDVVFLKGASREGMDTLTAVWKECGLADVVFLGGDDEPRIVSAADLAALAALEQQIEAATASLETLKAEETQVSQAISDAKTSLSAAAQTLSEKQADVVKASDTLKQLDEKIAERENRRLGRMAHIGFTTSASSADTEVKPEYYAMTEAQRQEALAARSIDGATRTGRDIAAGA